MLRYGASGGFGLIDDQEVDIGCGDGKRSVATDHFGGSPDGVDSETQGRESGESPKMLDGFRKRAERVVACSDSDEVQAFGLNLLANVWHLKEGDFVAARHEFATERDTETEVAMDRGTDDSNVSHCSTQYCQKHRGKGAG